MAEAAGDRPTGSGDGRARILLGVCGGIAAYKAASLLRRLTEAGHDVRVIPTRNALRFVGRATWEALSGHPATPRVFDDVADVAHVRLGQTADLVVVAPATADLLARAVAGRADDLLTATLLTARCPVLLAPAMHTEMWEHPATQANVATLRSRGAVVLEPAVGRLTGPDTGIGRMPEPGEIAAVALGLLGRQGVATDLHGRHVVVSAGGTREPIDPVRYLGNRSSGKQGYALARAAALRGASVTIVAANVSLPDPAGAKVLRVGTAAELRDAVLEQAAGADAVVMTAAVADFRPATTATAKLKRGDTDPPPLALIRNPDILAELSQHRARPGQVIVGFAAETDDALAHGRAKLAAKGCDLLVVNEVGPDRVFGSDHNAVTILTADGPSIDVPRSSKDAIAHAVWDAVVARLPATGI